jgi:hypothetical protein
MQNRGEMRSTELEGRRWSEGYEFWCSMQLISAIAAKRLSSTSFIIY